MKNLKLERNKIKAPVYKLEEILVKEVILDKVFPDRKNSKTEKIKAEIMLIEKRVELFDSNQEYKTYEEYKQDYTSQETSEPTKDDEIAELEAKLAALRG